MTVRLLEGLRDGLLMSSSVGEAAAAPGAGGEAPENEAPVEPKAEPKAEPAAAPAALEPPVAVAPPAVDWRDARIKALTAKLAEERRKNGAAPAAPAEPEADQEARIEAEVERRAEAKASAESWNQRVNSVVAEGRTQFTKEIFDSRVDVIRRSVDPGDSNEVQAYNNMIAAAIETGAAPTLLHELGGDPSKLQEVLSLPPVKMAVELTRLASALKAPAPLSAVPAPIRPIGSQGIHYESIKADDPEQGMKLPKNEWFAQREKQARERGLQ